ncbi:MAG: YeeE/YedE family protein [Polyangiales bacterium]
MSLSDIAYALAGGALLGLGASLLLLVNGRIAGISGIVGGLIAPRPGEVTWRAWFLAGLLLGGVALRLVRPEAIGASPMPAWLIAVAGVMVGFGTRLGGGCTSGHGVCGVSRFSRRSLVATATFIATGMATTYVVLHVLGAGDAP